MPRDSIRHTLLVATVLCVICSVLVSGSAVGLRSRQEANKRLDQQKNVLIAAGLYHERGGFKAKNTNADIPQLFQSVERVLIDLESGDVVESVSINLDTYDPRTAAKNPEQSVTIPADEDVAGIQRREKYAFVFVIKDGERIDQVVLPIYGKGLWSTLYGFLALDSDTTTVRGITFYEHAETPGLGGEIENPGWKARWNGKRVFGAHEEVALVVLKGAVSEDSPQADHQIDGLSGATITSRGVSNLVRFWLGPSGFGPYLKKLRGAHSSQPKTSDLTLSNCTLGNCRRGGDHG